MVRDFTAGDHTAVRDLVLAGLRERWGEAFDPSVNPDLDDISANYLDEGAEVIVIEIEEGIVATGILLPEPDGRGRIVRVSVDRRRRRERLGRGVIDELTARARRRGMVEVVVLADVSWTSAVALYRSYGFQEVGRDDTDVHFAMSLRPHPDPAEEPRGPSPQATRAG